MKTIRTIIAKPTKRCNAACSYCAAPSASAQTWTVSDFKRAFDNLKDSLDENALFVWHGGEPMLLGVEFYQQCHEYIRKTHPQLKLTMQSNLLAYSSDWKELIKNDFDGRISTSYEVVDSQRLYQGSAEAYHEQFQNAVKEFCDDGLQLAIIGVFTEETAENWRDLYSFAQSLGESCGCLRFNYAYPVGRAANKGMLIQPDTYLKLLLDSYQAWKTDLPDFEITPLSQMMQSFTSLCDDYCPWTNQCGSRFLGIEPSFEVYNCSEFAELNEPGFSYGNLLTLPVSKLLQTKEASQHRRRQYDLPKGCQTCKYFGNCRGGCQREVYLFSGKLNGVFPYCETWKGVYATLERDLRSGDAKPLIDKYRI